jgi:hypothetical protein
MGQEWKLSKALDRDLLAFDRYCVIDDAQLLVALPGHVRPIAGVTGVETCADLGLLALGEVLCAVAEQPSDLIERVVFCGRGGLVCLAARDAGPYRHLGVEPHHVERVEHGDGIWEAVMNRAGVAVRTGPMRAWSTPSMKLSGWFFNQVL